MQRKIPDRRHTPYSDLGSTHTEYAFRSSYYRSSLISDDSNREDRIDLIGDTVKDDIKPQMLI